VWDHGTAARPQAHSRGGGGSRCAGAKVIIGYKFSVKLEVF
jgi:hypothetical protein